MNQVKSEGFKPSLPPPQIVVDNPPSFGNYEDEKNVLHIAAWQNLPPDQQARFERLAATLSEGLSAQEMFEDGVHRWVFVNELGHWWQTCQHKSGDHYSIEYGANRIAAAYWRLKSPAFMEARAKHFLAVQALLPNPVPEGQSKEKYFDANYEDLARSAAYTWYQDDMIVAVCAEKPAPSFRKTLE